MSHVIYGIKTCDTCQCKPDVWSIKIFWLVFFTQDTDNEYWYFSFFLQPDLMLIQYLKIILYALVL